MRLQEDVEQRSVVLATNCTKMTARVLASLMRVALNKIQRARDAPVEGKQSLHQLAKSGTLQDIEISNDNIKAFEPYARKFGISYALQRDDTETPPKWMVFFRSKDTALMTAAFKEFSAKTLTKTHDKISVRDAIVKFRDIIKDAVRDIIKHKTHGEHER
ncbi:MAG: PcfB family protein [Defluviitaleaceae bacterium]|nr:PcfB family protein [Defluviitaleaceae bacterium]